MEWVRDPGGLCCCYLEILDTLHRAGKELCAYFRKEPYWSVGDTIICIENTRKSNEKQLRPNREKITVLVMAVAMVKSIAKSIKRKKGTAICLKLLDASPSSRGVRAGTGSRN